MVWSREVAADVVNIISQLEPLGFADGFIVGSLQAS